MGFEAPPLNAKVSVLCPSGTLIARCRMVIDFGKHPGMHLGKPTGRNVEKLLFGFEFPTKTHIFDEKKGAEPFTLSQRYNKSSNRKKGKLLPMLDAWLGFQIPDDKIATLRYDKMINRPALCTVVHKVKEGTQGQQMAIIGNITAPPEEMTCPPGTLPQIVYSVDFGKDKPFPVFKDGKPTTTLMKFEDLPEWIREECNQCLNWAPEHEDEPGATGGEDTEESNAPW